MPKSKRSPPWKGWGKLAPKRGRVRDKMKKKCGNKCFLGPKTSYPICTKNTCKVNRKGIYAAYIRARQTRKGQTKKKTRSKVRIANKAKRLLHIHRK
jgi:hypothetical protein